MDGEEFYRDPDLPYDYAVLEPVISAEQLRTHEKHHLAYIEKANEILKKLDGLKGESGKEVDIGNLYKKLSFNVGGHFLHSLYWQNMKSPDYETLPNGELAETIEKDFGSFEAFKKQFFEVGTTIEGSGWAALGFLPETKRLILLQIQNHNLYLAPPCQILCVMDMWEHAYYIDYKNDKKTYAANFQLIIDWEVVGERFYKVNNV